MTAIGKLLAVLTLVVGLGILTWSVSIYALRPQWFEKPPEGIDPANRPVGFDALKAEADALARGSQLASEAWGVHVKQLEAVEKLRADRKNGYAVRIQWAHKGHPKDKADKDNPASPGKGFYEHKVDPLTRLYDLSLKANGLPQGNAVKGTDDKPLLPLDGLLGSIVGDTAEILKFNAQIKQLREEYARLQKESRSYEDRGQRMTVIRDSALAEKFFLETFEVNVYETRETVVRRQRQLVARLKGLGVVDP